MAISQWFLVRCDKANLGLLWYSNLSSIVCPMVYDIITSHRYAWNSKLFIVEFLKMHVVTIFFCCRKIPRDLTEASLSGAGLSIIAALSIIFLFGMVGSSSLQLDIKCIYMQMLMKNLNIQYLCSLMFNSVPHFDVPHHRCEMFLIVWYSLSFQLFCSHPFFFNFVQLF